MPSDSGSFWGLLITVGGSVVVALVGGFFMLEAKRRPPAAEPTPIQDVWDENRALRAERSTLAEELRILRLAFGVALDWIERALRDWIESKLPPALSRREFEILEKTGEELPFSPSFERPTTKE